MEGNEIIIMDYKLINHLESSLKNELPGFEGQKDMAPLSRQHPSEYAIDGTTRVSGVLLLLYPLNNTMNIVFILRPRYNGVHSGQIAFPGGKREEFDNDITATALREAEEEVGVDRNTVTPIGRLTELYIPPSNALVTPTVGFTDHRPDFIPQPEEVADILESPIEHFLNEDNIGSIDMEIRGGVLKDVPYYNLNGHKIWGATAMMLSEFTKILKNF